MKSILKEKWEGPHRSEQGEGRRLNDAYAGQADGVIRTEHIFIAHALAQRGF